MKLHVDDELLEACRVTRPGIIALEPGTFATATVQLALSLLDATEAQWAAAELVRLRDLAMRAVDCTHTMYTALDCVGLQLPSGGVLLLKARNAIAGHKFPTVPDFYASALEMAPYGGVLLLPWPPLGQVEETRVSRGG